MDQVCNWEGGGGGESVTNVIIKNFLFNKTYVSNKTIWDANFNVETQKGKTTNSFIIDLFYNNWSVPTD